MKNYVQPGNIVDLTAPGGGVVSGNGYVISAMLGFAQNTAAAGEKTGFVVEGVMKLALDAATAVNEGDKVDFDATAQDCVATTLGDIAAGIALETKGAAAGQFILVKLERA